MKWTPSHFLKLFNFEFSQVSPNVNLDDFLWIGFRLIACLLKPAPLSVQLMNAGKVLSSIHYWPNTWPSITRGSKNSTTKLSTRFDRSAVSTKRCSCVRRPTLKTAKSWWWPLTNIFCIWRENISRKNFSKSWKISRYGQVLNNGHIQLIEIWITNSSN